jgi:hypothetical protein
MIGTMDQGDHVLDVERQIEREVRKVTILAAFAGTLSDSSRVAASIDYRGAAQDAAGLGFKKSDHIVDIDVVFDSERSRSVSMPEVAFSASSSTRETSSRGGFVARIFSACRGVRSAASGSMYVERNSVAVAISSFYHVITGMNTL